MEGGKTPFPPFIGYGMDMLGIERTERFLFFQAQNDVGGVVFGQIRGKHPLSFYFEASTFKMRLLYALIKGKGQLYKLPFGNHKDSFPSKITNAYIKVAC